MKWIEIDIFILTIQTQWIYKVLNVVNQFQVEVH